VAFPECSLRAKRTWEPRGARGRAPLRLNPTTLGGRGSQERAPEQRVGAMPDSARAEVCRPLARILVGCIYRRMPRMQLYLPDDLYELVKTRGLPASELLQKAVRAELRRLDLLEENARYLAELEAEVGEPTPAELARAKAVVERIAKRTRRKAG